VIIQRDISDLEKSIINEATNETKMGIHSYTFVVFPTFLLGEPYLIKSENTFCYNGFQACNFG
jgi:hypothetical protein